MIAIPHRRYRRIRAVTTRSRNYLLVGTAVGLLAIVAQPSLALAQSAASAKKTLPPADTLVAIVGATVIDGNGGTPLADATIVVRGKRIAAVGPRASTPVPKGARVIDGNGKFVTPGFIDTNVHLSLYNNGESMVRYEDRFVDLVIEAAQTSSSTASRRCVTATARSPRSSPSAIRSRMASCGARASSSPATSLAGVGPSLPSSRTRRRRPTSTNR
jgi:hypothetical protein